MAKTYNTISTFTAGQVLTAAQMNDLGENSNNYRVPPICRVRRASAQSIANNTQRLMNWDTQDIDTDEMFAASDTVITIKTAGVYLVTACVGFALNTTSTRGVAIVHNPVLSGSGDSTNVTSGTRIALNFLDRSPDTATHVVATTALEFAVNDTIGIVAYQNSGGSLNTTTAEQTTCSVMWLGQAS